MSTIEYKKLEDLQNEEILTKTKERISEINTIINNESIPDEFEIDNSGLWHIELKNDQIKRTYISSPIWITSYIRDNKNENHGRVLEFDDIDGYHHVWVMPMDSLAGEGTKILGALFNMGLKIAPQKKAKDHLLEYISLCNPVRRARCVLQCGWFDKSFVLPSYTLGNHKNEKIIYQNISNLESKTEISGTLENWQEKIAKMASGNSRLILSLSASFAGPLLNLLKHENIGIHFKGNSSLGKSTALHVANSIWGNSSNIYTFRATSNGLEGIASLFNDRLLCLDELGQISPIEAGQVFYMLGNGMGKARANQYGLPKNLIKWRLVFLSTGELSLAQIMNEIGKKTKGGQEVRLIEIPADTEIHGIFETLHGFENGSQFALHLKNTCANYYGQPSKVFLEKLIEDIDSALEFVKAVINGINQKYFVENASGQVIRVFNHLALIAATGELATRFGITGWQTEDAIAGVMKCFQDWIKTRGNTGMHEEQIAIVQVKKFFEQHGESRFTSWNIDSVEESKTINRVGFKRKTDDGEIEFYVFTNSFRNEICIGLDYHYVEKICIKHKLLMPGADNSPTRSERLPGSNKTKRCYRFTSEVLS